MSGLYDSYIQRYAKRNGLDWLLVKAIIRQESDFLPQAVSRVGARGLMQIMPKTWEWVVKDLLKKDYGWDKAFSPIENIEVGCRFLAWLYSYTKRYIAPTQPFIHKLVLAGYNWGIGRLEKNRFSLDGIPKETQDYIIRVTDYWKEYRNSQ